MRMQGPCSGVAQPVLAVSQVSRRRDVCGTEKFSGHAPNGVGARNQVNATEIFSLNSFVSSSAFAPLRSNNAERRAR